ncbi:MAG: hypothetical protein MHM6MM_000694 [Cercozoa sp. M6MM]
MWLSKQVALYAQYISDGSRPQLMLFFAFVLFALALISNVAWQASDDLVTALDVRKENFKRKVFDSLNYFHSFDSEVHSFLDDAIDVIMTRTQADDKNLLSQRGVDALFAGVAVLAGIEADVRYVADLSAPVLEPPSTGALAQTKDFVDVDAKLGNLQRHLQGLKTAFYRQSTVVRRRLRYVDLCRRRGLGNGVVVGDFNAKTSMCVVQGLPEQLNNDPSHFDERREQLCFDPLLSAGFFGGNITIGRGSDFCRTQSMFLFGNGSTTTTTPPSPPSPPTTTTATNTTTTPVTANTTAPINITTVPIGNVSRAAPNLQASSDRQRGEHLPKDAFARDAFVQSATALRVRMLVDASRVVSARWVLAWMKALRQSIQDGVLQPVEDEYGVKFEVRMPRDLSTESTYALLDDAWVFALVFGSAAIVSGVFFVVKFRKAWLPANERPSREHTVLVPRNEAAATREMVRNFYERRQRRSHAYSMSHSPSGTRSNLRGGGLWARISRIRVRFRRHEADDTEIDTSVTGTTATATETDTITQTTSQTTTQTTTQTSMQTTTQTTTKTETETETTSEESEKSVGEYLGDHLVFRIWTFLAMLVMVPVVSACAFGSLMLVGASLTVMHMFLPLFVLGLALRAAVCMIVMLEYAPMWWPTSRRVALGAYAGVTPTLVAQVALVLAAAFALGLQIQALWQLALSTLFACVYAFFYVLLVLIPCAALDERRMTRKWADVHELSLIEGAGWVDDDLDAAQRRDDGDWLVQQCQLVMQRQLPEPTPHERHRIVDVLRGGGTRRGYEVPSPSNYEEDDSLSVSSLTEFTEIANEMKVEPLAQKFASPTGKLIFLVALLVVPWFGFNVWRTAVIDEREQRGHFQAASSQGFWARHNERLITDFEAPPTTLEVVTDECVAWWQRQQQLQLQEFLSLLYKLEGSDDRAILQRVDSWLLDLLSRKPELNHLRQEPGGSGEADSDLVPPAPNAFNDFFDTDGRVLLQDGNSALEDEERRRFFAALDDLRASNATFHAIYRSNARDTALHDSEVLNDDDEPLQQSRCIRASRFYYTYAESRRNIETLSVTTYRESKELPSRTDLPIKIWRNDFAVTAGLERTAESTWQMGLLIAGKILFGEGVLDSEVPVGGAIVGVFVTLSPKVIALTAALLPVATAVSIVCVVGGSELWAEDLGIWLLLHLLLVLLLLVDIVVSVVTAASLYGRPDPDKGNGELRHTLPREVMKSVVFPRLVVLMLLLVASLFLFISDVGAIDLFAKVSALAMPMVFFVCALAFTAELVFSRTKVRLSHWQLRVQPK